MLFESLNNFRIVLASKSPRRKQLLHDLGLKFEVITHEIAEDYPGNLNGKEIALYLAKLKAWQFEKELEDGKTIVITADTVVWHKGSMLAKPVDREDAYNILKKLSGSKHEVITGVCLKSLDKEKVFHVSTNVYFKELSDDEIFYYIDTYKPFDKAGAYGIQEWIGFIGITHIEGSFYNVMGLPVQKLYEELLNFTKS